MILSRILESDGHDVIQAKKGKEAVELYLQRSPSLVFLDVLMPDLDGYEVASKIKENQKERWIPIIFLTSLTDAHDLAKCIECGGDDFVSKPINRIIIRAKVDALSRISKLYETIEEQKSEIEYHNEHLVQEQEAAKKIFNNIAHRGCLSASNINYHLSPMSIFNGDLMLAAETPMGGIRLMLADFTGHGLPAAIGAMPTSEIFYGMTQKGFSIADVMIEMNTRLYSVLPRGVFCCVIVADINPLEESITIWNAGAPCAYLFNQETGHIELIHSCHLPLGIQPPSKFGAETKVYRFSQQHRLLAVTDGIIESMNVNDQMFGEERILDFIKQNIKRDNLCDSLIQQVVQFTGDLKQGDDLSLLDVGFPNFYAVNDESNKHTLPAPSGTLDSKLTFCLRKKSLRNFDPIPLFLSTLMDSHDLTPHRSKVFTILSELYNNALEHGVLSLNSAMKDSSEGFSRYYQDRVNKLIAIDDGFVSIEVDCKPLDDGGEIIFEFKDSGKGFDIKKSLGVKTDRYSGRGIPLLKSLCDSLEFFDHGRHAKAIYRWKNNEYK